MPTRQDRSAARRREFHERWLEQATTDRDALWAACAWLVAAAVRGSWASEATRAVLDLVHGPARTGPLPYPAQEAGSPRQRARVDAHARV